MKEKAYKFPKDLGACLKLLAKLGREQDKLEAKLTPIEQEEIALREHILGTFKKSQLDGAKGSGVSLAIVKQTVPTVKDHDAFLAFAVKKANWDLLPRSVSSPAWRERLEAGKRVPGIEPFDRVSLRVTRT